MIKIKNNYEQCVWFEVYKCEGYMLLGMYVLMTSAVEWGGQSQFNRTEHNQKFPNYPKYDNKVLFNIDYIFN